MNRKATVVLLLAAALVAAPACGEEFPSRPVRFMIPLAPGGGADITVRAVAQKLSADWKQTVVVDNRPGGTGTIALEMAARAAPDGYTIIMISGSHTARQAVERDLPWNLNRDFASLTQMTRQSYILVIHPAVAAKSVAELVNLAKAKPGTLTYGSAGQGSLQHLSGALFGTLTQTKLLHVAYKGGGPAHLDLLAGHISMVFATPLESIPQIKAGRLRALGVTSAKRSPALPDLPTISEAGATGYEVTNWYGVLAPVKVPRQVVERLHRSIVAALQLPDLAERFRADGVELIGSTPAEFQKHIQAEIRKWEKVVAAVGIN
jgi:tripartite-type tricarboxylate transporter receptor subunit TctC